MLEKDGILVGPWQLTESVIYCIPINANQVLAIDPLGEFEDVMETNMQAHQEEFLFLF